MFAAKIYAISAKAAKSRRKRGANSPIVRMMKKMRRKILIMVMKSRLSNHGQSVDQDNNNKKSEMIPKTTMKVMARATMRRIQRKRGKKEKKSQVQSQMKGKTPQLTTDFQVINILRLKVTLVNLRKRCVTSTFVTSFNRGAKTSPKDSPKNSDTVATSGTRKAERSTIKSTGSVLKTKLNRMNSEYRRSTSSRCWGLLLTGRWMNSELTMPMGKGDTLQLQPS